MQKLKLEMIPNKKTRENIMRVSIWRVERPQLTFFLSINNPIYKAIIDENKQKTGCKDLHQRHKEGTTIR